MYVCIHGCTYDIWRTDFFVYQFFHRLSIRIGRWQAKLFHIVILLVIEIFGYFWTCFHTILNSWASQADDSGIQTFGQIKKQQMRSVF